MSIQIPDNFYDIIQGLENNDEKVSKYQNAKHNFEKMGIVLDALDNMDDEASKEIVIALSQNNSTKQAQDLRNATEEQLKQFSESFFETLKKQTDEIEFLETKITYTNNGNRYMTVITKAQLEETTVNSIVYYTVVNQQLIGITVRYLNKDIDLQETRQHN